MLPAPGLPQRMRHRRSSRRIYGIMLQALFDLCTHVTAFPFLSAFSDALTRDYPATITGVLVVFSSRREHAFGAHPLTRTRRRFDGEMHGRCGIAQDRPQFALERHAGCSPLHQHATAVERVCLAAHQIEFRQTVQCPGNRRLRHVQPGGEPTHRLRFGLQIAGQKNAKLARGEIRTIPGTRSTIAVRNIPARPSLTSLLIIVQTPSQKTLWYRLKSGSHSPLCHRFLTVPRNESV